MRTQFRLLATLLLLFGVAACTPNEAFRKSAAVAVSCTPDATERVPPACRQAITETTDQYDLHFVEFDDQGWTYPDAADVGHDPQADQASQQLRLVMERLYAAVNKSPVRVFVYIHGWKHNAAFDDDNVVNFRYFLKEAAQYEQVAQSTNRVIGIYVGWRGKSLDVSEPWISATFWDRKGAAQHVALGSVRELTAQLRAFQHLANDAQPERVKLDAVPKDQRVRIYMIGHSFGGLALYAAVSQSLVNGFVTGEDIDGKHPPVERLGDMIVLINPAFEATRYQPLDRAARNRKYDVYQAPVFISVTSDADQATGKLFPLGRTLNTIFESELTAEERTANRNTPGHIDAYMTHRLEIKATDAASCKGWQPDPKTPEELAANIQLEFNNSQAFVSRLENERWPLGADGKPVPRVFCGGLVLTPLGGPPPTPYRNPDPNMPLWNVTVTSDIIPDHNDINRPIFRAYLRQIFLDEYFNTRPRAPAPAAARQTQLPK